MPRWSEAYEVWHGKLIPAVYDYATLGRVADRLRIMAYDQHTPATSPGPIGGYDWTERVLAYTAGLGVTMGKVQLGIPAYGRRWGGGASTVAQRDAAALAAANGAAIRVDPVSRESYFSYNSGRVVVWYPSVEGSAEKVALARRYGCQGVVVWAAGMETNGLFEALSH